MAMKRDLLVVLILLLPFLLVAQNKKDTIRVFYLGGQSNMDGYGYCKDLPDSLNKKFKDVFIFHGNPAGDNQSGGGLGLWENLKPGHGVKFSSDGKKNKLTPRFGVELSFAERLQELFPGEKIALVKYSKGGTSIDSTMARTFGCWEPDFIGTNGLNQYDHCLNAIRQAMFTRDIDEDGKEEVLIPSGIIWMQGESDAYTEDCALRYYSNLKRLMDLLRAAFLTDDLPVVIGKISDSWRDKDGKVWEYGELIQHAQEKFAKTDGKAAIVRDTRYYKYSDKWHYDSEGYIDLGTRFADKVYQLIEE